MINNLWLKFYLSLFFFSMIKKEKKQTRCVTQFLLRDSWFKNWKIWLGDTSFDNTKLKIYKPPLTFLESMSAWKKSSWFINSYLWYSSFRNSIIWFAENLFLASPIYTFSKQLPSNLSQHATNSADWPCCTWDIDGSIISKFDYPSAFFTIQWQNV